MSETVFTSTHLLALSVEQIRGQRALLDRPVVLLLDVALVVRLERLLHLHLFGMSARVVQLGLVTKHLLRLLRRSVHLSGGPLSAACE